ncbi:MAG: hypothetical protein QXR28_00340 [Nitrososphaerota archaeon]
MSWKLKLSVALALGIAGLLAGAALLYQQPYAYAQPIDDVYGLGYRMSAAERLVDRAGPGNQMMRHGGWRSGGLGNFTASSDVVQLSGRLVELDLRRLVVDTGVEQVNVRTPMWLSVNNESVNLVRLAFEDKLNMGDEVQLTALKVTVTLSDGSQRTFYILRELVDLTTGLEATALHLRAPPAHCPLSQSTQPPASA